MDAAFSSLDFPGLDWGGYSREEVLDLLTEAALDSLDGTGADFAGDQPRVPAGSPEGGQFGPGGGGGGGGTKAERGKRRAEKEAAVRAKLGPERIATVRQAVTDLLPKYQHVALHGRQVKAFDPAVPENDLVRELDRRGLSGAGGYAHRLLDAMVFIGELAKLTTGADDITRPGMMAHSYRLPRPNGAAFAFDPDDFLDADTADPADPTAFFALAERDGAAAALAAWEEARFYSPDQPRDDRGRWSAGGGGGASATGGGPNPDALKGDIPSRFAAGDNPAHTAKAYGLPEDFYDDQRRMHHGASGIPDMTGAVYVNEKYDPEGKVAAALEAKADAYKRGLYEGSRRKGYDERVRAALAESAQRAAAEAGGNAAPNDFGGGMAHAGRAELRTASAAHVREFVAKGGPASGGEVAALGDHLARLTVSQLHDLRREHGLPAAGAWRMRRPDLVNALAGRFRDHRAALPTRAARELAAAAAGGAFAASKYTPGDSTHAVEHGRTGFTVSAHPDGRFHVWDTGLAHQGAHDTAAAAVAHAAAPPAKPSPDYQPRTADVETAARQGAVADAAARREGANVTHPSGLVPEVVAQHQAPYKGATLDNSHAQEKAGFPKALETLRSWPTDKLQAERRDLVRASFGGMFGQNARKLLAVVEQVIQERRSLESSAPAAGGGAAPKAGGFDPHAEAQAIHDLVGGHAAAMHAGAAADEGGRGGGLNRKYPRMDAAHATARREVEAHVADLVARAPTAAALRDVVRAYGLPAARGSKDSLAQQLRDVLRQRMATAVRVYASADDEPDPSEARFAAQRPVRFVPLVQPAEAARA